jgi:TPP-dependent 2-oxoacid decarboxylase
MVTVPTRQNAPADGSAQLTRADLWQQIEQDLDPTTTLVCETGDTWINGTLTLRIAAVDCRQYGSPADGSVTKG